MALNSKGMPYNVSLTTEERLIKYGLWPEEYAEAYEYDRRYTLYELKTMCRESGLPTGGEKKKLIAELLILRRKASGKE